MQFTRRGLATFALALLTTGATVGYLGHGGAGPLDGAFLAHAATAEPVPQARTDRPAGNPTPDFSSIVARYGPAVVNVSVAGAVKTANRAAPFERMDPNDPSYEFFRRFRIPGPQGEAPARGLGSGFIVDPSGIVLTNAHVVAGARDVTVKLTDRREFPAKVLGLDKTTDVAVLKIEATGLPTVQLGDTAQAQVGEWVLAIGSPFGFENSASAGIISAKSRSLPDSGYVPLIQTDVAVNPGNSGGPLFNAAGEVIAINSQIYSRTGGYQGLSFAIPIDVAMQVQRQIVAHGKVQHGRLGVAIQNVDQSLAEAFGLAKPAGALVSSVVEGGPAAKAGLQAGDVILAFNGKAITTSGELPPLVSSVRPGTEVALEIWRAGKSREVRATLGDLNEQAATGDDGDAVPDAGRLGLAVRPLTPQERRESGSGAGLVVQDASGAAARAGIQPGDVILSVNGTPVNSAEQLRALAKKAGRHVALLVQRDTGRIFVPIDLG